MHEPANSIAVSVLHESMRMLLMCNRKASPAQMREVCTAGPDGTLLKTCLAHVEREWPGETQAAGFFRDFHALPSDDLDAVRRLVVTYTGRSFRSLSFSGFDWKPEDFDEGPMWKFNGMD